jgi:hypothetical protein
VQPSFSSHKSTQNHFKHVMFVVFGRLFTEREYMQLVPHTCTHIRCKLHSHLIKAHTIILKNVMSVVCCRFFTEREYMQLVYASMANLQPELQLPNNTFLTLPPCMLKPVKRWSGKQVCMYVCGTNSHRQIHAPWPKNVFLNLSRHIHANIHIRTYIHTHTHMHTGHQHHPAKSAHRPHSPQHSRRLQDQREHVRSAQRRRPLNSSWKLSLHWSTRQESRGSVCQRLSTCRVRGARTPQGRIVFDHFGQAVHAFSAGA